LAALTGFSAMKTFLKVLLMAVLLIVAIKFSPFIFIGALVGLVVAAVLGALGLSLLAALLAIMVAVVLALSPIWLPILVVMGMVSLFRRESRPVAVPTATV
jgi:hypothetical protein